MLIRVSKLGIVNIREYEDELLAYATEKIAKIKGVRVIIKKKDN